jgi:aminoglycoside phosphotransferase (APT) family kinase protein
MAVFRRRRARAEHATAGGDTDTVAQRVLASALSDLGARPDFAVPPEAVPGGAGPDAYTFTLATSEPRWAGQLVARISPVEVLSHESRWQAALSAAGCPVPELVVDRPGDGLLVFRPPAGDNLAAVMATDLMHLPDLLATFGRMHARLHALPVDGVAAAVGPSTDPVEELAALAAGSPAGAAVESELDWLRSHGPASAPDDAVICHGDLSAVHVMVQRGDEPVEVAVNWTRARLADPSFDVAATLVSFWASPIYVANMAHRAGLKLARDSLASSYLNHYRGAASRPVDDDALAYWQAFHLAALALHLAEAVQGVELGVWHPAAAAAQPPKALQEVRNRFWELTEA